MDEKKIVIKQYGGYAWSKKRKVIPLNQKVREVLVLFGVYDSHTKWRYFNFYQAMKSENFIESTKNIAHRFKERIYLILDNHPSSYLLS